MAGEYKKEKTPTKRTLLGNTYIIDVNGRIINLYKVFIVFYC